MGKTKRGVRDGTGPFSGSVRGMGRRKMAGSICPFDEDNQEDIGSMDVKLNMRRDVKVVDDRIGRRRFR